MQNSQALLDQIKGYRPQTSVDAIRDFMQSSLYMDFQNELLARIEQLRDSYEDATSKDFLETQGGIRALRTQASTIFQDLLDNRKQDVEEERHG